ncbi:hypothetical protein BROUX41_002435 [Berkeleyomyces rouxiae]|uniref:uncharacterized protein n=1 Tax=Berkeleyomyces rouxiae TaxID=2035830 RepID=UPI003B82004B
MAGIDTDEWSTNSTETTTITLTRLSANGSKHELSHVASFKPTFTHQLFGEQEQIFGYKGLKTDIQVLEHCPRTRITIKYDKKFPKQGDVEADDVEDVWREIIDEDAFVDEETYLNKAKAVEQQKPAGELCHSGEIAPSSNYEVWHGRLSTPAVYESFTAMDFLSPLLIDGGSTITESPDLSTNHNWRIFSVYRKDASTKDRHSLVGYATVYTLYHFSPDYKPSFPAGSGTESEDQGAKADADEPCTRRIAQFVVLPPYQNQGVGQFLYAAIYNHYYKDASTKRLIVESPSNDFDDLRDVSDLVFLHQLEQCKSIKINTSYNPPKSASKKGKTPDTANKPSFEKSLMLDMDILSSLQRDMKIPSRQFQRIVEIQLMAQLPRSVRPAIEPPTTKPTAADLHHYRLWSLLVKERLVRQHGDALTELEHEDRILRLNETLHSIGLDYARLLSKVERAEARTKVVPETIPGTKSRKEKRKLDDSDQSEDEAEAETKRRKVNEVVPQMESTGEISSEKGATQNIIVPTQAEDPASHEPSQTSSSKQSS